MCSRGSRIFSTTTYSGPCEALQSYPRTWSSTASLDAVRGGLALRLRPRALARQIEQLQPDQVLARVEHAVAVVDAQPGHLLLRQQLADQAVRLGKDLRRLHAQADQVVHVEEAAVVDLLRRSAPVGQPVWLHVQELMQRIEAVRIAFRTVDRF